MGSDNLRLCKHSVHLQKLLLWCSEGNSSYPSFPSTFNIWNYYVRKILPHLFSHTIICSCQYDTWIFKSSGLWHNTIIWGFFCPNFLALATGSSFRLAYLYPFSASLLSGTMESSRFIWFYPFPSPIISHFSEKSWLILLDNHI